ncbi:unnamed protein product, partial [Meganyctiphanes norvegica]
HIFQLGIKSTLIAIGIIMIIVLNKKSLYREFLLRGLDGPIKFDSQELIEYIRNEVLDPPSNKAYNLNYGEIKVPITLPDGHQTLRLMQSMVFYDNAIKYLFPHKHGGWFVEAGALDGESVSNTLYLEKDMGWTGLFLVEVDERKYKTLLQKHRKAWSANVCLATHPYPSKELFILRDIESAAMGTLASHDQRVHMTNGSSVMSSTFTSVQCLPLSSILTALKVRHIDLLSLDVEGAELDILNTLDFSLFTIDVLFLEVLSNKNIEDQHKEVVTVMERRGFTLFLSLEIDYIFIRTASKYHRIVLEQGPIMYDVETDSIKLKGNVTNQAK